MADTNFRSKAELINFLIAKYGYKSYLEIGIRNGANYKLIDAKEKTGIEPYPVYWDDSMVNVTSDAFFSTATKSYDVILIDGDHHYTQVLKDLTNSLAFTKKGGCILLHDALSCKSSNPKHPTNYIGVWRVVSEIMAGIIFKDSDFRIATLDMDRGTVLIDQIGSYKREPLKINCSHVGWETFVANKRGLLNLVSPKNWKY
jgi:predicted O-methyltransferase YrrM